MWILRNNKQAGLKIDTRGLPSERVLNPLRSPLLNERMVQLEVDGEATALLSEVGTRLFLINWLGGKILF